MSDLPYTGPGAVAPIGFDVDEPEFEYHGESAHPDRVGYQCMCGHPDYTWCDLDREYGMTMPSGY